MDAFPPPAHSQLLKTIRICFQGQVETLDFEFAAENGLIRHSLTFTPLMPNDGHVTAALCLGVERSSLDFTRQDPIDAHLSGQMAAVEESNRHLQTEISQRLAENPDFQTDEAFFRENFQGLPDPTLVWRKVPEGEIRLAAANQAAARFFNGRAEDLVGLTLEDFYAHALQFIGLVQDACAGSDTRHIEMRFTCELMQDEKWVLCDFIHLSDRHVLNILRDITPEKDRQKIDDDNRNQVELLRQAMTAFTSVLNLDQVMDNVLEYLQKLIPHDRVLLYLLDGDQLLGQPPADFPVMMIRSAGRFQARTRSMKPSIATACRFFCPMPKITNHSSRLAV